MSQKQKVVILIDEYDKPMTEYMEVGKIETAKNIRRVFKSFYGVIKAADAYLRFVFITGVSKFSKVSLFYDLNNLIDITLSEKFSTLLGYTEAELHHYFSPYLEQMAEKRGMSENHLTKTIQEWYNGYSWDGKNFVYNPFSILNLFNFNKFTNYWFSTGTPTFLGSRRSIMKNTWGKGRRSSSWASGLTLKSETLAITCWRVCEFRKNDFEKDKLSAHYVTFNETVECFFKSFSNLNLRPSSVSMEIITIRILPHHQKPNETWLNLL